MSTSFTLFNFELNQESIVELFCINKEKPELHCDGKCYLKKQMEADEESHSDKPESRTEFSNYIFDYAPLAPIPTTPLVAEGTPNFGYLMPAYSDVLYSIFHPPQNKLIA